MLETIRVASERAYPPRVSGFTKPFWSALAQGRWTSTQCSACAHTTFPPKAVCPKCWSTKQDWVDLGSRGVLYAWTRIHAAPTIFSKEVPYNVCITDLECGIRLACKLLEVDGIAPRIGMNVEIVRLQFDDGDLFAARPSGNAPPVGRNEHLRPG